MKPAQYSLIQYVADPARGEPLNVGIVAWDGADYHLALDHDAVARVVRENPGLHRDSLFQLDAILHERLEDNRRTERTVADFITHQRGYPVLFSEPRQTTVMDATRGLQGAVERLLSRSVHPHRRTGGSLDLFDVAERGLREAVVSRRVARDFVFSQSRTGLERRVDYFANSGRNTALDILKLNLKRADEIRLRADAEAYKILDISQANDLQEFVVLVDFSNDPALKLVNAGARQILNSAAPKLVKIETDAVEAISNLSSRLDALR